MNLDDIQKSIQAIEKAEHIALILPKKVRADLLASAEVITQVLTKKNKRVGFIAPPRLSSAHSPELYPALNQHSPLLKDFVISFDTSHTSVSELRYERNDEKIDVILSPKAHQLSGDSVSFREGKTLCDCVITLGISDLETYESEYSFEASLFTDSMVINLDVAQENRRFGEINFVTPEKSSLSELTYEFLVALYNEPLSSEQATLLLSGIMEQTDGFLEPLTSADTLLTSSELLRLGASHHDALALAKPKPPLELVQLFGRAQVRSKMNPEKGVVWSFLTIEDFEKTERTPRDCEYVLSRLAHEFAGEKICILLWQGSGETEVSTMITAAAPLLDAIKEKIEGEIQNTCFQFKNPYASFRDAEERIGELLASVL